MPDWSYQTVFRPILFQMSPAVGRDLALSCLGTLARFPFGPALIDFLGHARPDESLQHTLGNIQFPGRVGLGACLDPQLLASRALSRFGVAYLEVGPTTVQPEAGGWIDRDDAVESIAFHSPHASPGLELAVQRLRGLDNVRLLVHLDSRDAGTAALDHAIAIFERLGQQVAGIIVHSEDPRIGIEFSIRLRQRMPADVRILLLLAVAPGASDVELQTIAESIRLQSINGVYLDGAICEPSGCRIYGRPCFEETRNTASRLRSALPSGAAIIASGGVHEPIHALDLIDAGCDLVSGDTGLVFSGPGLPKRVNEAILWRNSHSTDPQSTIPTRIVKLSWFWTFLMASGMIAGGLMALVIAGTRVVMPYDEATVGMTRDQMVAINEHLLHFMRHDRMTLAGTMLAVGILYLALSLYGSRRGMHWAHVAIVASAFAGFASFFLFLGFGYFDPFHAFVTAVLLQLLLLAMHSDLPRECGTVQPELTNDRAWQLCQWGQLLFIVHGAVLMVAGGVIASYGITTVFVPEDLEFMQTTAEHLHGAHPQLVPLVAHDRATFGGMLVSCGTCVLLSSLWGFRRGNGWLWWALMLAGSTAYLATILVHWHVGYSSLKHLLPAYGGLALLLIGGVLSRKHLCTGGNTEANRI